MSWGYKLGAYYIKPFTSTQLINGINLLLGSGKASVSRIPGLHFRPRVLPFRCEFLLRRTGVSYFP
jgi:hypothetical protein